MPQLEVTENERKAYPTYATAARVVEGNDLTSPIEFIAWTTIRSLLIMPGMAIAGIRGKKLIIGALLGSTMVSTAALWRSYATKQSEIWAANQERRRRMREPRRHRRLRQSRTRRR